MADAGKNLPSRAVHANHRSDHELQLKSCNTLRKCNGCKRPAFGLIYRCELCDFTLHTDCMFPKSAADHDLFENFSFEFLEKLPGKCRCSDCHRYCEVCAKPAKGSVYHCEKNGCNLHPCCLNIPSELNIDEVEFELTREELYLECLWCDQKRLKGSVTGNSGWSYVSKCKKYRCHAFCSTEMILKEWKKADSNGKFRLVPKNLTLPIKSRLKKNKWKGNKFVKIAKIFFEILVSILIGDPTTILTSLVLGQIFN